MEITAARRALVDFTDPYYYMAAQVVAKKGGTRIHGVNDLFDKRVGVGAGTAYAEFLRNYPQIKVKAYTTDADVFPDLSAGKIDFVLTGQETARYAIHAGQPLRLPEGRSSILGWRSPSARVRRTGSSC
jgi:L-cystine transport system substrate-binding protein